MYIALFDKDYLALGKRATYHASAWSLRMATVEMDSFTATCQEIENSVNALFVGLFEDTGRLKYLAFSGAPKTERGVTSINGRDLKWIFRQKRRLNYSSYAINASTATIATWVSYLLSLPKSENDPNGRPSCGLSYSVDVSAMPSTRLYNTGYEIPKFDAIGDVWEELVRAMNIFGFVIETIFTYTNTGSAIGSITFKAKPISKTYDIRLSDFDHPKVRDDASGVNRSIAYQITKVKDSDGNETGETTVDASCTYVIVSKSDGTEEIKSSLLTTDKPLYPSRMVAYEDEDFDKAKSKAVEELTKNLYNASVELNCGAPLAKYLVEASEGLAIYGKIYGYNAADLTTYRVLPLQWKSEDSKGNVKMCFGRLDDYKYL